MKGRKKLMVLEQLATEDDGFSEGAPEKWEPVQEVWVFLQNWNPRGSAAIVDALQVKEQSTHFARMRHIEGVKSAMRLRHGDRVFAITSVQAMQEANRFLDLRLIEAN